MKKTISLIATFTFMVFFAFSQEYAVYVTAEDYTNNTPIRGTALKETSGRGASNYILTLPDGKKQEFKPNTFWGLRKPASPSYKIFTDYRYLGGELFAIFTSGDIIGYHKNPAGFKVSKEYGEHFFFVKNGSVYISKGAQEPISQILLEAKQMPGTMLALPTANDVKPSDALQEYMDKAEYVEVKAIYKQHPEMSIQEMMHIYNNMKSGKDTPMPTMVEHIYTNAIY